MNELLMMLYIFPFLFFLAFWLEDSEDMAMLRPLLLAIFWPVVLIPLAFSLGIGVAKYLRNRRLGIPG